MIALGNQGVVGDPNPKPCRVFFMIVITLGFRASACRDFRWTIVEQLNIVLCSFVYQATQEGNSFWQFG